MPNSTKTGITLNSYVAQAGICSRRKAAELIKNGSIKINNVVVDDPSYRIASSDIIMHNNGVLEIQKKVYLLLNKPKDYICTVSDEKNRKTVLDLVSQYSSERLYPVGRLDRATTGLLVLTNDGQLAQRLAHPSFNISKIYRVTLDKSVAPQDLKALLKGLVLEDGFISAIRAQYTSSDGKQIEVEISSGRNRIVRRMFEHLGYEVLKLDRTHYAFLTKKNLSVGETRLLTAEEIQQLFKLSSKKN